MLTTEQVALWRRNAEVVKSYSTDMEVKILQDRIIALADAVLVGREAQPVAYAVFADNGNIRIWSTDKGITENVGVPVPLYTAPPAPINANAVAWEMRYWNSGHNCWHDWERITAEQHAELSAEHAASNDYEFRVLYDAPPAPAVPEEMERDPDADVFDPGFMNGWNACRAAMLGGEK